MLSKTLIIMQSSQWHQIHLAIEYSLAAFLCNRTEPFVGIFHHVHMRRRIIGIGREEAKHSGNHEGMLDAIEGFLKELAFDLSIGSRTTFHRS